MSAGNLNLTIERCTTFEKQLLLKDSETKEPMNLENCIATMQIRKDYNGSVLATPSIIIDIEIGSITLGLTSEQTAVLEYGTLIYDLMLAKADQTTQKLIYGNINIIRAVTR